MNIFRVFRLGVKFASWVTPHVKELHRRRHLNRTEGQRHLKAKNWSEAEKHLTAALGEHHSAKNRVEVSAQLARALASQNKLEEAAQTAQGAAEAAAKSRNADVQWEALETLAYVQLAQRKADEAIQTMDQAENHEMKRGRPDKARLALSMRRRGKLLLKSGRAEEAFKALDDSLKITEMNWGAEHEETANALTEIGSFHGQFGNHGEAQKYLQRALAIYRTTESYGSTQSSEGVHLLALSLEQSGDVEGAVRQYERFLALSERQIGGNRGSVAKAQVHLAELYLRNDQSSMAREVLVQAVHTLESMRGEGLPQALELMAVAEEEAGRPQEARRWREKASKLVTAAVPA
jgi:tetratricopeptide (TPR) repeat protein